MYCGMFHSRCHAVERWERVEERLNQSTRSGCLFVAGLWSGEQSTKLER